MLESLYINNFRCFSELTIKKLGLVNLIVGKNNSGKSSLLEAIMLNVAHEKQYLLSAFLKDRSGYALNEELHFLKYSEVVVSPFYRRENRPLMNKEIIISQNKDQLKEGLKIELDPVSRNIIITSNQNVSQRFYEGDLLRNSSFDVSNAIFIRSNVDYNELNAQLWGRIQLTNVEDAVTNHLKHIDDRIEKLAFELEGSTKRAMVKLRGVGKVPLKSLGEGTTKFLTIMLAMLATDVRYVFIDEIENGLHHSVQDKLWEILFKIAELNHIQLFVTTHSTDCVKSFEHALNQQKDKSLGILMRLDNKNGVVKEVEYSADELEIATNNNIEVR
ncbi:MAG: AAA family ATPase [Bacteroidia bacterium]